MRIAVMGAGAIGCYYGALLARAGQAVVLIGRAAHVEAVRAHGLRLETASGIERVPLHATTDAAGVAGADLVLVCVKSGDTEETAERIAPHLSPEAVVLSFQNGVDNAERLSIVLGRPAVPAVLYVATAMAGPGHVRHHGRGDVVIAATPRDAEIAAVFEAAGIPTTVSDRVIDALWVKLIINCAYNALSALTQLPYARLAAGPGVTAVMADAVDECVRVARACGVTVPDDIHRTVAAIAEAMPNQTSSTAQDLARGRPSEIDHLNGFVLRRGTALGIPTPVNRVLHTLIKLAEAEA